MSEVRVRLASEVDGERLHAFLRSWFGAVKADFLRRHGDWWHRGKENRWVLVDSEVIAGYCGVIPTTCWVAGVPRDAVWWMDLVIAPEYRGLGLQTRFDDLMKSRGSLLLGFPNELAAKIHRKHGWGVRETLKTLLLPLDPPHLQAVVRSAGWRGAGLRLGARLVAPAAAWMRWRSRRFEAGTARQIDRPDFEQLADLASKHLDRRCVTVRRDADFLRWRYDGGPHRCLVYGAGMGGVPSAVLIARRTNRSERWLDLFGDLQNPAIRRDLIRFAIRQAVGAGMSQITVLSTRASRTSLLRPHGFVLSSTTRFCWLDDDRRTMAQFDSLPHDWCLGDSDNDDPGR